MSSTLLATKLFIPQPRPRLVSRPQLIERLNTGLARKLTLISAPAGFGKTTMVSEWTDHIRSDSKKVRPPAPRIAWLSLDKGDNDPARFLAYLITALNQIEGIEPSIGKGALGMLRSHQSPPTELALTSLINEFAALPERIILVLDDYHLIETQPIHDALTFLLEYLPPQLRLVIITRVDPPLPLARLRARAQMAELRAADLRFSPSEAADFLNQVMGLNLSIEEIAALETRTEGWIAGLQLAAISFQGSADTANDINSFTGSHRFVLDYLLEEVLKQQSESIQTFLLQTSILHRLSGSLCDALSSQDNGQSTLEMLEHTNLFVIPLDEERCWYRYHHLFADSLRQRLRQKQPELTPRLHRRASEWYEQNGFADEAIEHALRGEDFERAARLIEEYVDALWQHGEHTKVRGWLDRLPVELVFTKPVLCIFHAWYAFIRGQQDTAERSLQTAELAMASNADQYSETGLQEQVSLTGSERLKLQGRVAAIRTFMNAHQGNVQGLIQHARQALEHLPEHDRTWRSVVALTLGDVYGFKGDMTAAYEARFEAFKACKAAGDIYYTMLASMKLAITLRSQGWLQKTMKICQQQIQFASEYRLSQTPLNGLLLTIWGEVLAELNDLDQAYHQGIKGIQLAERAVDQSFLGWGYMCQIRILFSRGDLVGAEKIIHKIGNVARESNVPPWVMKQMAAWQARLWLAQDKLEAAAQWAAEQKLDLDDESKPQHEFDFFMLFDYLILARILMAKGRVDKAITLLHQLLKAAEMGGRTTRLIEILNLQALTFQAGGNKNQAMNALEQALTLAQPEGFVRTFVDEGPPMARLLYEALSRGIAPDYVRQLLAAFPKIEPEPTDPSKSQSPQAGLIEPLSERELEVLLLIAEGLTNREIAARLYLSLNTVKVHTRNIYGKLGVNNRTQAGARARTLGILPSN